MQSGETQLQGVKRLFHFYELLRPPHGFQMQRGIDHRTRADDEVGEDGAAVGVVGGLLDGEAREAEALYILGDLFESWVGDDAVPVAQLCDVLGLGTEQREDGPLVVIAGATRRHAFQVDALLGQRDVVVKGLGRLLPRLDVLAGASVEPAVLAGGSVGVSGGLRFGTGEQSIPESLP